MIISDLKFREEFARLKAHGNLSYDRMVEILGPNGPTKNTLVNYLKGHTNPAEFEKEAILHKLDEYVRKMRNVSPGQPQVGKLSTEDENRRYNSENVFRLGGSGFIEPEREIPIYTQNNFMPNTLSLISGPPIGTLKVSGQPDAEFSFIMYGGCMLGEYSPGDHLTVLPQSDTSDIEYGAAYLIKTMRRTMVRYIHEGDDDDSVMLVCHNAELLPSGRRKYPDYKMRRADIIAIALILGKTERKQVVQQAVAV